MGEVIAFPGNTPENSERITPEEQIASAKSFEALETALDEIGRIQGSSMVYSAGELIDIISSVRKGESPLLAVTGTHGLREKVKTLVCTEQIQTAATFSELLETIDTIYKNFGTLQTSSGEEINQEQLISFITEAIENNIDEASPLLHAITSQYSLREIVVKIIKTSQSVA